MAETPQEIQARAEATQALADATANLAKALAAVKSFASTENVQQLKTAYDQYAESLKLASTTQKKSAKEIEESSAKMKGLRGDAAQTLRTLRDFSKSSSTGIGDLTGGVEGLLRAAGGIVAMKASDLGTPFKIFDNLAKPLIDIDQRATRTFGNIREGAGKMAVDSARSIREFILANETGVSATLPALQTLSSKRTEAAAEMEKEQSELI